MAFCRLMCLPVILCNLGFLTLYEHLRWFYSHRVKKYIEVLLHRCICFFPLERLQKLPPWQQGRGWKIGIHCFSLVLGGRISGFVLSYSINKIFLVQHVPKTKHVNWQWFIERESDKDICSVEELPVQALVICQEVLLYIVVSLALLRDLV